MEGVDEDFLYHFGFGNKTMDIPKVFGDTKFVCTGGSPTRLKIYAEWFAKECKIPCSENLSKSDRFVLFKTGKVVWVNKQIDPCIPKRKEAHQLSFRIIRLGTSGGVGVEPGTVIVSKNAINAELNEQYVQWIAGQRVVRETYLDEGLRNELIAMANEMKIPVDSGFTMCADDFYEGQMRLDGFFCEYKPDDKFAFLKKLHDMGVRNIEMESTCFSSMTLRAGCKGAVVCVTLLNRMKGDQIKLSHDQFLEFEERPFRLVTALMKKQLGY
ncbi:uridine phosphorylase [Ancylostoma ceylanicum]|uniref:Uridine phosphorylase n=1 Tax=Ancylostoma ceylanicum TaxID=53326 RepID=A0A0D6M8C2_9BILA|nr:uridine phosphorylase [Ancylostoma ceylanicum]